MKKHTLNRAKVYFCVAALALMGACGDVQSTDDNGDEVALDENDATTESQELSGFGVEVICNATNTFGYVGVIRGALKIKDFSSDGRFNAEGVLTLKTKFYSDPNYQVRKVKFHGYVDADGANASLHPVNNSPVNGVTLYFKSSLQSNIDIGGTQYQTKCNASKPRIPQGSDLIHRGRMRIENIGNNQDEIRIDVKNVGNKPTAGLSSQVSINGTVYEGALRNTAGFSTKLYPGDEGYIRLVAPHLTYNRCLIYSVKIDLNHAMQKGKPNPYANDTSNVNSPCLRWITKIDPDTLGFGMEPHSEVVGKSISDIINSVVEARVDNNKCNVCHSSASSRLWKSDGSYIGPTTYTSGYQWKYYWMDRFIEKPNTIKPDYLDDVFTRWFLDGGH